jgi:hypothetical protein
MAVWRYRRDKTDTELRSISECTTTVAAQRSTSPSFSPASAADVARALLISRLADRYETADRNISQAERKKALSAVAALMNAERGNMELHAKLLGLLSDQHQQMVLVVNAGNMQVNVPAPDDAPESPALDLQPDEYTSE